MNVPSDLRASRQFGDSRPPHQVSFEFFPPKTDAMEERFWDSVHKLAPLHPRFVSVTYGAGGTTRERTLRMVSQIQSTTGVNAAAHLTCVGASKAEVDEVVRHALFGEPGAGALDGVAVRDAVEVDHGAASSRIGRFATMPPSMKTLADWLAHAERLHAKNIELGLERVRTVAGRMGLATSLAWAVMPDHLHWMFELRVPSLAQVVGRVKACSARRVHALTGDDGVLWQPGYYDHRMRDHEDLAAQARYILANPVRCGLAAEAGTYPHAWCRWPP